MVETPTNWYLAPKTLAFTQNKNQFFIYIIHVPYRVRRNSSLLQYSKSQPIFIRQMLAISTSIFSLLCFDNVSLLSNQRLKILETNNIVDVSFTRKINPTHKKQTKISHFVYRVSTNF